jgi:hypothetical protein
MSIGQIVENDRFISPLRQEKAGMRTDIAGTADDKDFLLHQSPFRKKRDVRETVFHFVQIRAAWH